MHESFLRAIVHAPENLDVSYLLTDSRAAWLVAVARGVAFVLLLAIATRMQRRVWALLLLAFVSIDLSLDSTITAPRKPIAYYRESPAVLQQLPAKRDDFRIFHLANWLAASKAARFYRVEFLDRYWLQRNGLFPMIEGTYGFRNALQGDYDMTALLPTADFTQAVGALGSRRPSTWLNAVTAMSNIRFVGVYRRPEQAVAEAHGAPHDIQPIRFVEGGDAPRYYFATQLVAIRDASDFVDKLASERFDRHAVFLTDHAFDAGRGAVGNVREWPNGARLDVDADAPAFLFMSVTPHKYWTITIDDIPAEADVANIGYQGVRVPPGHHVVEMRYRNPLFAAGGAITVVALLAIGWACTMRRL
jgi:hypothetical protein